MGYQKWRVNSFSHLHNFILLWKKGSHPQWLYNHEYWGFQRVNGLSSQNRRAKDDVHGR